MRKSFLLPSMIFLAPTDEGANTGTSGAGVVIPADPIGDYIRNAMGNHQSSFMALMQAFYGKATEEVEAFWKGIVTEAGSLEGIVEHEIVKLADSVGFTLPGDPRATAGVSAQTGTASTSTT